jgi:D-3-phosphoglycerate dehydrogenase
VDAASRLTESGAPEDETLQSLVLDLLEWVGPVARPYDEVIDAWRTSCPRLPVWEEAKARGLIVERAGEAGRTVAVSAAGAEHVRRHRTPR